MSFAFVTLAAPITRLLVGASIDQAATIFTTTLVIHERGRCIEAVTGLFLRKFAKAFLRQAGFPARALLLERYPVERIGEREAA